MGFEILAQANTKEAHAWIVGFGQLFGLFLSKIKPEKMGQLNKVGVNCKLFFQRLRIESLGLFQFAITPYSE